MLKENRYMSVKEMVISFIHIVAHHMKNKVLKCQITRSGEIISRQFHVILKAVLRLHALFFKKPKLSPENSVDGRWKWIKVLSYTQSN